MAVFLKNFTTTTQNVSLKTSAYQNVQSHLVDSCNQTGSNKRVPLKKLCFVICFVTSGIRSKISMTLKIRCRSNICPSQYGRRGKSLNSKKGDRIDSQDPRTRGREAKECQKGCHRSVRNHSGEFTSKNLLERAEYGRKSCAQKTQINASDEEFPTKSELPHDRSSC